MTRIDSLVEQRGSVEPMRRETDGTVFGYRCSCGGFWKVYQAPHHARGCPGGGPLFAEHRVERGPRDLREARDLGFLDAGCVPLFRRLLYLGGQGLEFPADASTSLAELAYARCPLALRFFVHGRPRNGAPTIAGDVVLRRLGVNQEELAIERLGARREVLPRRRRSFRAPRFCGHVFGLTEVTTACHADVDEVAGVVVHEVDGAPVRRLIHAKKFTRSPLTCPATQRKVIYMEITEYTIIAKGERGQVLIETADGRQILVNKRGLPAQNTRPISLGSIRVDDDRAYAPAR